MTKKLITLADLVKRERHRLAISQAELSRRVGVTRACVCALESGAMWPSLQSAYYLSKALRIDLETIAEMVVTEKARASLTELSV